jgi:hypothetical protein
MTKFTLDLDKLTVDPFEVEAARFDGTGQATISPCIGSFSAPYAYCLRQPASRVPDGVC